MYAAQAPLDRIPIFVRAGSIVPLGPAMEWSAEKAADPIELRVYGGADGDFTLYEDENDSYRYEKGVHAEIPMHWDNEQLALTIGTRRGEFPGMLRERTFHVVFVRRDHGVGVGETEKPDQVVRYSGAALVVKQDPSTVQHVGPEM